MENNNGKFISNLAKYGGWIVAIASFGWMAGSLISNKVSANDFDKLQAQIVETQLTNGKQDTDIKNIYDSLKRIETKLDRLTK